MENNFKNGKVMLGDCLDLMESIPDKSVDMILCDLPYQITNSCTWDTIIPFNGYYNFRGKLIDGYGNIENMQQHEEDDLIDHLLHLKLITREESKIGYDLYTQLVKAYKPNGLWQHYNRIIKDSGAIVLTACNKFHYQLVSSNLGMYKYEWVWEKTQATGHLNAKKRPMNAHEFVNVFYKKQPTYNPQKTTGHSPVNSYTKYLDVVNKSNVYGKTNVELSGGGETDRYPRSVLKFPSDKQTAYLHPTQKPVALFEYMVKTYTNEGDLVLDNCAGSGTTAIACLNTNRKFTLMEKERNYYDIICKRITKRYEQA